MNKCEIVYTVAALQPAAPLPPGAFGTAVLSCVTHNCSILLDAQTCMVGRIEALEERVAKLERGEHETNIDVGDLLGRGR
jgi:hypothetical protein